MYRIVWKPSTQDYILEEKTMFRGWRQMYKSKPSSYKTRKEAFEALKKYVKSKVKTKKAQNVVKVTFWDDDDVLYSTYEDVGVKERRESKEDS